jgi:hypothetical protein
MQVGIIGLPQVGKTTVFNTLTKAHAEVGFASKKDPNIGIVKIPDERLDHLTEMFNPKRKVPAIVEYVDVAGLSKGASQTTGFSQQFINAIKLSDALIQIVRVFENETVMHSEGDLNPRRDINIIQTEFIYADLMILENRIERLEKQLKKIKNEKEERELILLKRCKESLEKEIPLREMDFNSEDQKLIKGFQFLTSKPMILVLNLNEKDIPKQKELETVWGEAWNRKNCRVTSLCAKIEMEITQLPPEEEEIFLKELGIQEPALDKMIRQSYDLLGVISFFTVGEDECRAWTIKRNSTAPTAAGAIHSDFEKGFIRAEVVHYPDFIAQGSMLKCKEKGLVRLEGKEYIVQDGDIINFRFAI